MPLRAFYIFCQSKNNAKNVHPGTRVVVEKLVAINKVLLLIGNMWENAY